MNINLKKDFNKIYNSLKKRISDYPIYINEGPGKDEDSVTQITLGFYYDQSGWVAIVFDTRPRSEPDGEWNSYIEETMVEMDSWFQVIDGMYENEKEITITTHLGKKQKINHESDSEKVCAYFGDMLKDVLLKARVQGILKKLPIHEKCKMGVEESCGLYGWPIYKKRNTEGKVLLA